jgi:hypothetical protein
MLPLLQLNPFTRLPVVTPVTHSGKIDDIAGCTVSPESICIKTTGCYSRALTQSHCIKGRSVSLK